MPRRIYRIHDNGGLPFKVEDRGDAVQIWKQRAEEELWRRYAPLIEISYTEIFPGRFPHRRWRPDVKEHYRWKPSYKGNSVLLSLGDNKYVFIGQSIWEFSTGGDRILEYYSPIGNSDVPYPFAVGENYTYLMLEKVRVPNALLDSSVGPYAQVYGFKDFITRPAHRALMAAKQALPVKMIQERL